jgi:hypothetical protein
VLREIRAGESYEETGSHLAGVHHADPAVVYRDLTSKKTTNCRFKRSPQGRPTAPCDKRNLTRITLTHITSELSSSFFC